MKNILLFAVITLFYACKTKEVVTPNRPPNAFTVTPTLKSDGKTIVLNWTKAKDPDGDAITYTVVLKDTLVKNISDTTYTIRNLDFNYSQTGKIIAKDAKGLTAEASFTAITKAVTFVNIPDPIFEKHLIDNKIDKDGLVNGKMSIDDAKGVTMLNLQVQSNIKDLTGIEAFIDLKTLSCSWNPLIGLDVSKNINLTFLDCYSAQLTSLDVSKNINLTKLVCYRNRLTNLDLSKNVNLQNLSCGGNQLTNLDVSKNLNLQNLECSNTGLTNLDISKNVNLKDLSCGGNKLTNLDVNENVNLQNLDCWLNQLTYLDVSKNVNLQNLDCWGNRLTNLDLSKNVNLQRFHCAQNALTTLDLRKNANLNVLSCSYNQIKTICVVDVAKAKANTSWTKDQTATYEVCK